MEKDRRGTFWDWPVGVIVASVVLGLVFEPGPFAFLMFWFGVLALLIRRGAFSPRRR
jgi:hypothetical protein